MYPTLWRGVNPEVKRRPSSLTMSQGELFRVPRFSGILFYRSEVGKKDVDKDRRAIVLETEFGSPWNITRTAKNA